MWSRVCRSHSIRYIGESDLRSTSWMVPAQPPSGMSGKSGSVVPGFTRTCAPAANRAGVRGIFSFFLATEVPPASSLVILGNDRPPGQAPTGFLPVTGPPSQADGSRLNDSMTILFLHGWQSVPGGVKPTFLAQHGHEVINPKLPDEDFNEAVRIAQVGFDKHHPDVVVGSSRGGAVAMNIISGGARLVLLCPAWKKYGT